MLVVREALAILVDVGDQAGGFLDLILKRMSIYLNDIKDLKDYIVSAMIYPLFLICIGGISILILLTYVIPKFAVIFADLGQAIPLSTQLLLSTAAFFQKYFLLLLAIFAALIFFWRQFSKSPAGRYRIDSFLERMPIVFDDPFLRFDDQRIGAIANALKYLGKFGQVLHLTSRQMHAKVADFSVSINKA